MPGRLEVSSILYLSFERGSSFLFSFFCFFAVIFFFKTCRAKRGKPLVRAQGIATESPQELHGQFRGLAAESPVFFVRLRTKKMRPKKDKNFLCGYPVCPLDLCAVLRLYIGYEMQTALLVRCGQEGGGSPEGAARLYWTRIF
ncbi:MAG: hypothetical protein LBK44_04425 [Spirochaetales bacterium]|nr:hypothetical protein [Spirochaetales bacterium]